MKFGKDTLILICIGLICCILLINMYNNKSTELENKFQDLKNQNDSLIYEIDSLKIQFEKYSRQNLSKISKVNIPSTFGIEKIKVLVNSCKEYNVPLKIACRLIYSESTFNPNAISYSGAKGFMQLMPSTIKYINKKTNISKDDKHWNIKMGVYYLSYLYNMFKTRDKHTRWRLAVLSYNIGPGRVLNNPDSVLYEYKDYKYLNKILGDNRLGNIY